MASGPCYPVFSKTVSYLNRCYPDASVVSELIEDKLENIKVRGAVSAHTRNVNPCIVLTSF